MMINRNILNRFFNVDKREEMIDTFTDCQKCDSDISSSNKIFNNAWKKLKAGQKVMLSYNEICDLEDYVTEISEADAYLFNKKFEIFHDKRVSCGISRKDHVCSLRSIDTSKQTEMYLN